MEDVDQEAANLKDALRDMEDVLKGTGKHASHERSEAGGCVHCSCGAVVRGKLLNARDGRVRVDTRRYEAVMPDGFVAYSGPDKKHADDLIERHPDWRIRHPGEK